MYKFPLVRRHLVLL